MDLRFKLLTNPQVLAAALATSLAAVQNGMYGKQVAWGGTPTKHDLSPFRTMTSLTSHLLSPGNGEHSYFIAPYI